MRAVIAWVEGDPEIMGDAADLAEALGVPAWGVAAGTDPAALAAAGSERIFMIDGPYDATIHSAAIASICVTPLVMLLPGSANGSDLAPRLAARLGAACLLDCAWLRPAPDGLQAARWAHDDRALERWQVPEGATLVATLRPRSRGAPRPRRRQPRIERLQVGGKAPGSRLLRNLPADPRSVGVADADRIVAAGLGIGSPDLLPAVQNLADLLGAALGASRPLADRGWVPFHRQIGTTGQQVSPGLYVAIGVSGATQHMAGIGEAETVVAINTDPGCPMMARANLAAVGDAAEVVPALQRKLRQLHGAQA
ncbi:MAG TPA: electron transfer flavoprotein subunit alpha/FixB family protein [Candidatus Dormibacteraeota bacterium]|nr:electron transfer flavoprotein subunit alpha/FixB family protein [Candidatus Dormibacteraeota bacterium]